MRVLVLSPGFVGDQLERLPAIEAISRELPSQCAGGLCSRGSWRLGSASECGEGDSFDFESSPTLAD